MPKLDMDALSNRLQGSISNAFTALSHMPCPRPDFFTVGSAFNYIFSSGAVDFRAEAVFILSMVAAFLMRLGATRMRDQRLARRITIVVAVVD